MLPTENRRYCRPQPHLVRHPHVLLVRLRGDARPDGLQLRRRRRRHHVRQRRVAQVLRAPPQEPPQVLLADAACGIGPTSSTGRVVHPKKGICSEPSAPPLSIASFVVSEHSKLAV